MSVKRKEPFSCKHQILSATTQKYCGLHTLPGIQPWFSASASLQWEAIPRRGQRLQGNSTI